MALTATTPRIPSARVASERIRLLKFVTFFAMGGTERQVTALAKGLDASRFALSLACLRRGGDLASQMEQLAPAPPVEYRIPLRRRNT